jgi:hypothetical protein
MPKRLSIAREASAGSLLLPDVPRPDKLQAGTCRLIRALWAMLIHAGVQTDYDALMGLTGIAFGSPAGEDFVVPAGDALRCRHVAEALAALGLTARYVALEPGDPDAAAAAVEEGLSAGFAVPVLGWPEEGSDWGVITGADPARGVIFGWPARPSAEVYVGTAPRADAAVVITGQREPMGFEGALRGALERALEREESMQQAYGQWASTLRGESADARWSENAEALVLRHEKLWDDLSDARTSAGVFLEAVEDDPGGIACEWLWEAAEHAGAVTVQLSMRSPAIGDIVEVSEALQSAEWRDEWLALLHDIAKDDQAMFRCIRSALRGEDLPEPGW